MQAVASWVGRCEDSYRSQTEAPCSHSEAAAFESVARLMLACSSGLLTHVLHAWWLVLKSPGVQRCRAEDSLCCADMDRLGMFQTHIQRS